MNDFLVRLLITIGIIWLTQFLLGFFNIKPEVNRIILGAVVLVTILYLLFGLTAVPTH